MKVYQTPGVHHERADADAGGVNALRTDIAAFVGIAERGPLHLAVPVESYRQFQAWFGDTIANGYLACCARAFFENGGRRLWAVRVASEAAAAAAITVFDDRSVGTPLPLWRIESSSPGSWGNALAVRLVQVRRAQRRARLDATQPRRVTIGAVAGFERHTLVELQQPGAAPQRAVVQGVDAAGGALELDRSPSGFAPNAPLRLESIAWTLEIVASGRLVGVIQDLALVPEHPRYAPAVLKQPWQTLDTSDPSAALPGSSSAVAIDYFRIGRNRSGSPPPVIVIHDLRDPATRAALYLPAPAPGLVDLQGGSDGLRTLDESDFVGGAASPLDGDLALARARRGLAALDPVEELGIVAIPDIHIQPRETVLLPVPRCEPDPCLPHAPAPLPQPPLVVADLPPRFDDEAIARVQAAQVLHCERHRDRFALLDAPFASCTDPVLGTTALRAWRQRFDTAFAALYAPWARVVDPLRPGAGAGVARGGLRAIPPCGHVAGSMAATDLLRGVHVAPANVPLLWLQGLTMPVDDERHGLLNSLGINVLRADAARGVRVMGARTLSSDSDWRFVNVRRLMSMIERAIDISIQWAVFEPNDWRTRAKLALVIGSFLQALYDRGAMVGATAEQAFFVRCDEANNPAPQRERGELRIDVGVAASAPFEFIVLRIGRDANGFAVHESLPLQAAA